MTNCRNDLISEEKMNFGIMQTVGCIHGNSTAKLGFYHALSLSSSNPVPWPNIKASKPNPKKLLITQSYNGNQQNRKRNKDRVDVRGKKENVWNIENEMEKAKEIELAKKSQLRKGRGRRLAKGKTNRTSQVMVSAAMLMEVETVLQTQEPVIKPAWNTFASSVSGIWKGVGAVFSPLTAKMEPIDIGKKNENLYDCYTLSRVEAVSSSSGGQTSQIQRTVNWVTLNPHGETLLCIGSDTTSKDDLKDKHGAVPAKEMVDRSPKSYILPTLEYFNFEASDVMEEDSMGTEPGLVYFEDGSYSRGPVEIPVGDVDGSQYYLSPTFKFEQCLVKGCHKRLRIIHTIEFGNGGSDIQIMRVAVYEEQWVSPANIREESDQYLDLKPFSQRKRTQPSELTGAWKVFEVNATPVFGDELRTPECNGIPYVYLCTETLKKRNLPETSVFFEEEEMVDMQDATVLWLPGGVTAFVDVGKDGVLCIGVGWYSDEGINLVMERDYGLDGKLNEVRWKSEVKRRWSDPMAA